MTAYRWDRDFSLDRRMNVSSSSIPGQHTRVASRALSASTTRTYRSRGVRVSGA